MISKSLDKWLKLIIFLSFIYSPEIPTPRWNAVIMYFSLFYLFLKSLIASFLVLHCVPSWFRNSKSYKIKSIFLLENVQQLQALLLANSRLPIRDSQSETRNSNRPIASVRREPITEQEKMIGVDFGGKSKHVLYPLISLWSNTDHFLLAFLSLLPSSISV